jgi:hypothetical protein
MKENQDPIENERAGASARLNPMFGDWQLTFPFAPVPYGAGAQKRAAFREAIQNQLTNKWIEVDPIIATAFCRS